MMVLLALALLLGAVVRADPPAPPVALTERGVTNVYLVSDPVLKPAWRRTAVMAGPDNRPLDPSGQLAAHADAASAGVVSARAGEISEAASEAVRLSVGALTAVTNQVPAEAVHIALNLPWQRRDNLRGRVVDEGCEDGTNEWQMVEYSQLLAVPPSRTVAYIYPGGTATVAVVWARPWSETSTVHRCTFVRPRLLDGVRVFRTRRHDLFGGPSGLSFGSALVTVDGLPTYTGVVTNSLTGAVLVFENGVLKDENR